MENVIKVWFKENDMNPCIRECRNMTKKQVIDIYGLTTDDRVEEWHFID